VRRHPAHDRTGARSARRLGAGLDVDRSRERRAVAPQRGADGLADPKGSLIRGQQVELEPADAAPPGVRQQLAQERPAEAPALQLVGHGEGEVGDRRRAVAAQVARGADDAVVPEREQADVAIAVDTRERVEDQARELGRHAGEEALITRLVGQAGEELGQQWPVTGQLRSQQDRRAVAEQDGGAGEHP
jgi:hypothetical protein